MITAEEFREITRTWYETFCVVKDLEADITVELTSNRLVPYTEFEAKAMTEQETRRRHPVEVQAARDAHIAYESAHVELSVRTTEAYEALDFMKRYAREES